MANDQTAVGAGLDAIERENINVNNLAWALDVELHEIDERSTSGDEADLSALLGCHRFGGCLYSLIDGGGLREGEGIHVSTPVGSLLRGLGAVADLLNGRDDVRVGTAATYVAVHRLLDVGIRGPDVLFEHRDGGHDLARGAVATLVAVVLNEGDLHGMEMIGLTDTFDGCDLVVPMHDGEGETGVDSASVDMNRACSALPVVAAFFGAGQRKVLAEAVEQSCTGVELESVGLPVDFESEGNRTLRKNFFRRNGWRSDWGRGRREHWRRRGGKTCGAKVRKERTSAETVAWSGPGRRSYGS